MEIRGCPALVTGAGRGIGKAITLALAREGARVLAVARTASDLEALVREAPRPGEVVAFPGDLRDAAVCSGAVEAAARAFGGLQVLVNNAGVGSASTFEAMSDEEWARVFDTNLTAVFRITRAALPYLFVRGGHVFMISSLAGRNPVASMSAYCASKAALDHLAACLMLEVRYRGVKVTTIAPGSVATDFPAASGLPSDSDPAAKLQAEDLATTVLALLHTRDDAHLSRVELRPLRPQKR